MEVLASAVFWVCFTTLTQLSASSTSTKVSLDEGRILVSWSYDEEADKLSFKVNASTVGWVGFGFARFAPNKMQDYDLILAGYKEGRGYIFDMYSIGQFPPPLDSRHQDYHLAVATEEECHIILHFDRAANTGDTKDIQFTDNVGVFLVWALHSSVDATSSTVYPFYERKGSSGSKQLIQTGGAFITQSMESEPIPDSPTQDRDCALSSANDLQPRRASGAHFHSVNPLDLNQERVEGIHFRTRKLLSIRSADSNSGLDENSSQETPTPVTDDMMSAEQNKRDSSNKEKARKTRQWIYFSLLFLGVLIALYIGYYLVRKKKIQSVCRIRKEIVHLSCDGSSQSDETIQQIKDQINVLVHKEKDALYEELHRKVNIQSICRIRSEILDLPSDGTTHCDERIRQLKDRINALRHSNEKDALYDELKWKEKIHRIRQGIAEVENNNTKECGESIRSLENEIRKMEAPEILNDLFQELQTVAHLGLKEDLQQMLPTRRSKQEALNLVLNKLTDIVKLVKYLNKNSNELEVLKEAGLRNLTLLLGQDLEVLCKLEAKGIDISKEWARNLSKNAPNLHKLARLDNSKLKDLCRGAEVTERRDVYDIIFEYTIQKNPRLSRSSQSETSVEDNNSKKHADVSKLKEAKQLCNEAKELVLTSQSEVSGKISKIIKTLELPQDWLKGVETTSQLPLLEKLGIFIDECSKAMESESAETYGSNVDVITKASAGRALCAVYYSKYEEPKPAYSRLLQVPTAATFANPENTSESVVCEAFSKKGLASNHAKKITKLGFGIDANVSGLNGMLTARGDVAFNKETQSVKFDETSVNTASALYYIRTDKQTFQFKPNDIRLSSDCVKDALCLVQDPDDSAVDQTTYARGFLKRYGSHFPTGVQTLGGVFFTTADVESEGSIHEIMLKKEAQKHLKSRMSIHSLSETVGMIEGNMFCGTETSKMDTEHIKQVTLNFSYLANSIGPGANYATFHKLLSYNSNWALIDRGNLETANIPVWKLIKDLGGVFKDAGKVLEDAWNSDESERRKTWEKNKEENDRKNEEKEANEELKAFRDEHLLKAHTDVSDRFFPTKAKVVNEKKVNRRKAYDRAINFILRNPRERFCQITHRYRWPKSYDLMCLESSAVEKPEFSSDKREHVLFFSEKYFIWKGELPGR